MFRGSWSTEEFNDYLQNLLREDRLAFSVVEIYMHGMRSQFPLAARKGTRLLPKLAGRPRLAWRVFLLIGVAYRSMGEMETGETYFRRALEMAELTGDSKAVSQTRFQIHITRFSKAEYEQAYRDFLAHRKDPNAWEPHRADYFLGTLAIIRGQPEEAIRAFDRFIEASEKSPSRSAALEIKGLALRMLGKLPSAMEAFVESARSDIDFDSSYSAFPVAKAIELARLAGLEPPPKDLTRKALSLAKRGSWGEQAAAQEIEALLRDDDAGAAEGLYEAAKNYLRAYQNIEAVFSGLTAAYLAWRSDSPVFTKALKLIAPFIPLHPGLKRDPVLGDFMSEIEPFLTKAMRRDQDKEGIRAYLIGGFRVFVDGKEIRLRGWERNRAIKAFCYLLLSPKHRIPKDHLFYLLWPRNSYNNKTRYYLYNAIATVRRNLGRPDLLTHSRDFYQLENVWTDLGELENLVRLADATIDPAQKEEYLARARELARGELLPEFPYDKHIEEYRQYYERLRKKVFGDRP